MPDSCPQVLASRAVRLGRRRSAAPSGLRETRPRGALAASRARARGAAARGPRQTPARWPLRARSQSPAGRAAWRDRASGGEAVTRTWISEVGTGSDSGRAAAAAPVAVAAAEATVERRRPHCACCRCGLQPSPGPRVPGLPPATAGASGGNPSLADEPFLAAGFLPLIPDTSWNPQLCAQPESEKGSALRRPSTPIPSPTILDALPGLSGNRTQVKGAC